ncbi:MAG: hypothetical protein U1C55_02725 [Smithellaceae bacterium]|nr:hypothetical protein [Smithellaceae bacterium]
MKRLFPLIILLIAGCASVETPAWTFASFNHLENYKQNFLIGKNDLADFHFQKAQEEIKKSGDIDILAKAFLTRSALLVAVLEAIPDQEYPRLADIRPMPENQHYFLFLQGSFPLVDGALIPEQYRDTLQAIRKGDLREIGAALAKIENPLSGLVATGVVVAAGYQDEYILQNAIDTASKNGWKRALLAYLRTIMTFYEKNAEVEKAARIRKVMELIKS